MKKWWWLAGCIFLLAACGEEPKKEYKEPDWDRLTKAEQVAPKNSANEMIAPATDAEMVATRSTGQGGVTLTMSPDRPGDRGCLRAVAQGQPGRAAYRWFVNGQLVPQHAGATLCSDYFKRGDEVRVSVGTIDVGADSTVTIRNTPPEILEVSISLNNALQNSAITATAVGSDIDGDEIEYLYQWLINEEEDAVLTESVLPASSYVRGDKIEVVIVPSDGTDEGLAYRREIVLPKGPPRITSQPSQNFKAVDYIYQVVVENASEAVLSYRLEDAPAGMMIDPKTGLVKWPLVGVAPGQYDVTIIVTDAEGGEAIQAYKLNLGSAE